MISDISIGQYYTGNSFLHKMDARMKFVLIFALLVFVFLCKSFFSLALMAAFTVFAVLISRIPLKMILKSIKPLVIIILFTALLNVFYTTGGRTYFEWHSIKLTEKGVNTAIFMAVRILVLVVISSLLTYTTTPTMLTDAIERLLSPLSVFHIKVHTLAMMMTLALRFIPTLIEETQRIMNAQKARGAELETGGLIARSKALVPVFVPLMVSSFRRAYELAFAMTCRCYTGGEGRTRMKQMKLKPRDYTAAAFAAALLAGVLVLNHFFKAVI